MTIRDVEVGPAPLTTPVLDLTSIVLRDLLMPEAEAEDWNIEIVDGLGVLRVLSLRRQARAAGNDDPAIAIERFDRVLGLSDLGSHTTPPDPRM